MIHKRPHISIFNWFPLLVSTWYTHKSWFTDEYTDCRGLISLNMMKHVDWILIFICSFMNMFLLSDSLHLSLCCGCSDNNPITVYHTHTHTRSPRYSGQWITGGWSRSRWRLVLPCDSPHTSSLLSRKLNWKFGPWKSAAPIYPQTRANDLSFLSGVQAAALAVAPPLHQRAGRPRPPLLSVFMLTLIYCKKKKKK